MIVTVGAFFTTVWQKVITPINVAVRIAGQATITACNIVMLRCFKKKTQIFQAHKAADKEKEKIRVANQRSLFKLVLCESVITIIPGLIVTSWSILSAAWPVGAYCHKSIYASVIDLAEQLAGLLDVYCMLVINVGFRAKVKGLLNL